MDYLIAFFCLLGMIILGITGGLILCKLCEPRSFPSKRQIKKREKLKNKIYYI